jgi:nicotinamide-nucleotide amidase
MLADGPTLTKTVLLPGNRSDIRERSTTVAMHLLRRALLGAKDPAVLRD